MPGTLANDLLCDLWIWRPILAGKVSLTEVKSGIAGVHDLLAINALLDMQADIEAAQYDAAKSNR